MEIIFSTIVETVGCKYSLSLECHLLRLRLYHDLLSRQILLTNVHPRSLNETNKITIVGVGDVGMACAFSILTQGITTSLCLTDAAENKMLGEMLDLQHGSVFLQNAKIASGTDYSVTAGSRVCIITAGVRQHEGEPQVNLVQRNVEVMKTIVPQLVKHSPDSFLLVVTNPVDIMTYVAWKLSGFPKHRVIGAGTNLDSSRFRFLLSQKLGIAATDCEGWVIGEHGDSSVAVWSSVNFAGVRLRELNPKAGLDGDPENWAEVHKAVVDSVYQVIKRKGYTNWAIGFSVAAIVRSILENIGDLHAVSVHVQGLHGIKEDVFLSLPAVVGAEGIRDVVNQQLDEFELSSVHKSAEFLSKVQADLIL